MIYSKFKATYDGNHDTFRVEFLVVPTAILAFLVNHDFTPLEVGFCGDCRAWVAGAADSRPSQVSCGSYRHAQPRSMEAGHTMCCCSVQLTCWQAKSI